MSQETKIISIISGRLKKAISMRMIQVLKLT